MLIVELQPRHGGPVLDEPVTLQRAAYAVEAALIGFDGIPQLQETAAELRAAPERWLSLRDDVRDDVRDDRGPGDRAWMCRLAPSGFTGHGLVGAVAFERRGDTLDICRLVVAPRAHRRGHATALLDALDTLDAREPHGPADRTAVSTGTANAPALALYRGRGFLPTGEREIPPGLTVTALERRTPAGRPSRRPDERRPR